MNQAKWLRISLLLLLALGLAIPVFVQAGDTRPTTLSDSQEPGSVIVFPKFIAGTVPVDGEARPATELEVGVICPKGVTCTEHTTVKLMFHWVCPADQTFNNKFICHETDFTLTATYFGKLVIGTDGSVNTAGVSGAFANVAGSVPVPPCPRGYLIGWVVDTSDRPIKFDGLIGDAVLRESPATVSAYNAIPIQADPALATNAPIALSPEGGLVFDGAPGHYQAVTGKIYGDVRFDNLTPVTTVGPPPVPPGIRTQTFLTLLTLDVHSNRPNLPTFVDLKFYNENERLLSTFTEFICWTEVPLTTINAGLNQTSMGTRKGLVVSGAAEKVAFGFGDETNADVQAAQAADTAGPVTLLGIVDTLELGIVTVTNPDGTTTAVIDGPVRAYSYSLFNDSVPVPTTFFPAN
jgi:hypothetical protein